MQNINLKYLIIGVISLSILIVAGAVLFSLLQDYKKSPTPRQQTSNSLKPSPVAKPAVKNPQIRIVYPKDFSTGSARFKTAPAPATIPTNSSASGTESIPKSILKP